MQSASGMLKREPGNSLSGIFRMLLKSQVPVLGTEANGNWRGARARGGGTRNLPACTGVGGWRGAGPPGCFQCHSTAVGLMHTVWGARD